MDNRRQDSQGGLIGGLILIGIGTMFLLDRFNFFRFDIGDWWPMFLIIPGLAMALDTSRKNKTGAFFLIAFGTFFQIAELGLFRWWRWRNVWPVLMILMGFWMLFEHLRNRENAASGPSQPAPPGPPQFPGQ